jgi:hypothetical protein
VRIALASFGETSSIKFLLKAIVYRLSPGILPRVRQVGAPQRRRIQPMNSRRSGEVVDELAASSIAAPVGHSADEATQGCLAADAGICAARLATKSVVHLARLDDGRLPAKL